jgi:PhzF family phenazine biosynthesis protein
MATTPEVKFFQVDAFTDRPFRGNAAGVFVLEEPMDPRAMQLLARETNLSETAFVSPPREDGVREVRWFTPAVEVSLCGHATLAVGHVIANELGGETPVRVESVGGSLVIDAEGDLLSIRVPADPPTIELPPSGLLRALGCHEAVPVLRSDLVWVVRLSWQREVEALTPNVAALLEVDAGEGVLGVAVTAPALDEDVDFVSRFFAPWVGVPEDPVTGVAYRALAPYWAEQMGRTGLVARQLSSREGIVRLRVEGDQVELAGRAVTVAQGMFLVPYLTEIPVAAD